MYLVLAERPSVITDQADNGVMLQSIFNQRAEHLANKVINIGHG
jgi:DUF917 family protein